jgi:uncharacterized membrane protein
MNWKAFWILIIIIILMLQGEFAAREDAARELGVVTDRLQGSATLQEEERAMLLRKQDQLTRTLDQHSSQASPL